MEAFDDQHRKRIVNRLTARGRRYDFFRLLSELERLGFAGPRALSVVANPSRTFPGSDVEKVSVPSPSSNGTGPARVVVNFHGLTGVHSNLPWYFQSILDEEQHSDTSSRAKLARNMKLLFDLITNRLYQQLYRIWGRTTPVHATGRNLRKTVQNPVLSVCGLGYLSAKMKLNLLHLAPFMLQVQRSKWGLRRLLATFLGVEIEVLEFEPLQVALVDHERTRLGRRESSVLGRNLRAIPHRNTRHNAVRIVCGPLTLDELLSLLEGGERQALLAYLSHLYLPIDLEYNVELRLAADQVSRTSLVLGSPKTRLGSTSTLRPSARLDDLCLLRRGITTASNPDRLREIVAEFDSGGRSPKLATA